MIRPIYGMGSGPYHRVTPPETPVGPKDWPLLWRNSIIPEGILRLVWPKKGRGIRLSPRVLVETMPLLPARLPFLGLVDLVDGLAS